MMSAENKHIGKKKKELVLILVILAVSALLYAGTRIIFSKPPMRVEISVDGTVIETLDLNKDTELTVEGWNGGTNHVVIKNGTVHVTAENNFSAYSFAATWRFKYPNAPERQRTPIRIAAMAVPHSVLIKNGAT